MEFCFEKNASLTLQRALSLEWLETNGIGGYSSSSIINAHTRKYHGLLVCKLSGLPDKYLLLSQLDDCLVQGEKQYHLSAHSYQGFFQDGSFGYYQDFFQDTHPRFTYQFGELVLTKEILMPRSENTVLIKYKITGKSGISKISVRPLIAMRNFHQLSKKNNDLQELTFPCANGIGIAPYRGMPNLYFQTNGKCEFLAQGCWYYNFTLERERERGYDFHEDLYSPGILTFTLDHNQELIFSCSVLEQLQGLDEKWQQEVDRRLQLFSSVSGSPLQKQLHKVANSFIETSPFQQSALIVAGYHWFLEWGRDAMIALPGLTLYSGQEDVCLQILKGYSQNERDGLIPNFLGSTPDQNAYNSVDASLWFAWAVQQYYMKTKDLKSFVQFLWPTLKNIFLSYKNGTRHNIKMQDNGLIWAGSKGDNLTWMDAVVDGIPVTPRFGYQVEVNALWYNLLGLMREMAELMLDPIEYEIKPLLKKVKKSFQEVFWNSELGYLYDFVNSEQKNSAIRPNQIFAVSMSHSPLTFEMAVKVVNVVKEHLLTPYGLRTLSSQDPNYVAVYEGNQAARDRAYHNGVIWPWLIGHFADALLRTSKSYEQAVKILWPCLDAMTAHLSEAGIGTISEIFSNGMLHQPNGCISQAWSVAEVLRLSYLLSRSNPSGLK